VRAAFVLFTAFTAALILLPGTSEAIELVCADRQRDYLVSYHDGADYILVAADGIVTAFEVELTQRNDAQFVVVAKPPNEGPTISLRLRPRAELGFWIGKKLVRIDTCREP